MLKYTYQRVMFVSMLMFAVGVAMLAVPDTLFLLVGAAITLMACGFFAMSVMMRHELLMARLRATPDE